MKQIEPNVYKTFESFLGATNKWDGYENVGKSDGAGGEVDAATRNAILDVKNFDKWLTGRNKRLIGMPQALQPSVIEDYFFDQGVQCTDQEIFSFIDKIKGDWMSDFHANKF